MLDSIIGSKTRIKLLLKFFLNPETTAYLRGLATEFNESTNGLRLELNHLTAANLLTTRNEGRKKLYQVNTAHPLFDDIHNIVKKYLGIDHLVEDILAKLGNIDLAFITGDYARGSDSGLIDLVIIGAEVDQTYLQQLVKKAEKLINRKIRTRHSAGVRSQQLTS